MSFLVFRTDIRSKKKAEIVKDILKGHPFMINWSIDTDDIDNVLRVKATQGLREIDVIRLIKICGFHCEALPD